MRGFLDRVPQSERYRVEHALDQHLKSGAPFEIEHEIITHTGELRIVRSRAQATWDDDGRAVRVVGTLRDVTDQRKLERDLLRAEEIAEFGSWVLIVATQTMRWSPQVYRIHGYAPYSVPLTLEMGIEAYHQDDRADVERSINTSISTGEPFSFEARIIRPDGTERNVFVEGGGEFGEDGAALRIFGIIKDQTALKRQERELERSHRIQAIGQLVGGVAHDFNNILAVIMGNLEMLEDLDLSPKARIFAQDALAATERGSELTQSLLSFARSAPLKEERIDPVSQVNATLPLLKRVLPENITLSATHGAEPLAVNCDPTMLEACVMNLVLNSRDAMPRGGAISIILERKFIDRAAASQLGVPVQIGPYVSIAVTDTGVGMTQVQLERATEPFFTTKKVGDGTGLGLSRVAGFAEQSGGFFRLYSEIGMGTTAQIFLPETNAVDVVIPVKPNALGLLSGRVLLVEDQEPVRNILEQILTSFGLQVDVATNGDDGFNILDANPVYGAIVTDIVMPGKYQGTDLVRNLRKRGHEFSAVFVSGYARNSAVEDNDLLPRDSRLTKPITKMALHDAMARIFRS